MTRFAFPRLLAVALVAGSLGASALAAPAARAAAPNQTAPPAFAAAQPTVSGKLIDKAGASNPLPCGTSIQPATTRPVNRGLVVCTDQGQVVLIQLSNTPIFNRDWQRIGYNALQLGDRINAWGTLRNGGTRLYPTVAVQDLSRGGTRLQTVTGRLVAKPDEGPSGPVICGDHDRTPDAQAAMARGLVICTEEGKLILLQLSGVTRLFTRDRARVTVEDLTLNDSLTATGRLQVGGTVMYPTLKIVDANLQLGGTNSQDMIASSGPILVLYVLASQPGPVTGRVLASPGEPTHVRLCNGKQGSWSDLKSGLNIDVTHSIFNSRTMEYVDTSYVTILTCR